MKYTCWYQRTCKRQSEICDNLKNCELCTRYLQMRLQTELANIPMEFPIDHKLDETKIRYIVDDVLKFVKREIRRNHKYDVIIMDPPSFGRGTNGEVWNIEKNLYELLELCQELLSDKPLFMLVNSYSGLSPILLENMLKLTNKRKNIKITSDEIGLPIKENNLILPCGIYGRVDYE